MKIIIAGDFCPQNRIQKLFDEGKFSYVFSDIKATIEEADYSIVNFECPIAQDSDEPILKVGPNICCSSNSVNALKYVGFKAVTLANNHIRDYGDNAVRNTINILHNNGIETVGGGTLNEARRILYHRYNNKTVAIVNCCEHEFSIATESNIGANPLNTIKQYYDIIKSKEKADWTIVIVHGGNEHYPYPSPRMKETYRYFIDAGADVVINHHQHCYSGYEIYNMKPIFYGLGNFCFDYPLIKHDTWHKGYMVELILNDTISYRLIPYIQCKDNANVVLLNEIENKLFFKEIKRINSIIQDNQELRFLYNQYLDSFTKQIDVLLQPYSRMITRKLYINRLLPSLLPKRKLLLLLSYLQCESHLPKALHFLKNRLEATK